MSNLGIGRYGYTQPYNNGNLLGRNNTSKKSTSTQCSTSNITLNYTDKATGKKATNCVGFPNGSSASVFRSERYSPDAPSYLVKYWDGVGNEQNTEVNPKEVDPENASYLEMLAYSTYADESGYAPDAFHNFNFATLDSNGNMNFDAESIHSPNDFKALIADFMDMQYKANNHASYLSYKRFFDFMNGSY